MSHLVPFRRHVTKRTAAATSQSVAATFGGIGRPSATASSQSPDTETGSLFDSRSLLVGGHILG